MDFIAIYFHKHISIGLLLQASYRAPLQAWPCAQALRYMVHTKQRGTGRRRSLLWNV